METGYFSSSVIYSFNRKVEHVVVLMGDPIIQCIKGGQVVVVDSARLIVWVDQRNYTKKGNFHRDKFDLLLFFPFKSGLFCCTEVAAEANLVFHMFDPEHNLDFG